MFGPKLVGRAVHLAVDLAQRPSYETFYRALQHTVDIGAFSNCSAKQLTKLHPELSPNIAACWRKAQSERTILAPFPPQLEFLKDFLPFHYLLERFGDVFFAMPGLPLHISDTQAQQLQMLFLVLPSFVRVPIKRAHCQVFHQTSFDKTLDALMKQRKVGTVARISLDVRTIYNTMVKYKKISQSRSTLKIESAYQGALRLASALIWGKLTLNQIIATHKILLYDRENNIDTVKGKFRRLSEFLQDVAPGVDLAPITDFLEDGYKQFDSPASQKQSDPIPPCVVGYEVRTFLNDSSQPHKQVRSANVSLLTGIGARYENMLSLSRKKWDTSLGLFAEIALHDTKTKKAGDKSQNIRIPFFMHDMSPDRAALVLDDLVGADRLYLLGYVPKHLPVCKENYVKHTRGSLRALIKNVITDTPARYRAQIPRLERITPNTWRFTAEEIRLLADVAEKSKRHAKQHKPKDQTEHYNLQSAHLVLFGEHLLDFWAGLWKQLECDAMFRSSGVQPARQTYSSVQRRKRRRLNSGLSVTLP